MRFGQRARPSKVGIGYFYEFSQRMGGGGGGAASSDQTAPDYRNA
jgi:hypothetical protein